MAFRGGIVCGQELGRDHAFDVIFWADPNKSSNRGLAVPQQAAGPPSAVLDLGAFAYARDFPYGTQCTPAGDPQLKATSEGNQWGRRFFTESNVECSTDLDWIRVGFQAEKSRRALNPQVAQERTNCLQIASAFQNVESLGPPQGVYAIVVRIEFCFHDPELHETVQLVWGQRTVALDATAWEQIVVGLFTGVGNPLFKCFCGYLGQTASDGWSSPFL